MPYVFDHLDIIKEVLRYSPFGLITDIDGTISRSTLTPQEARVSPLCHQYLTTLCNQLALVAAISGRSVAAARDMVNIDDVVYIGNHGLERWSDGHSEFSRGAQDYFRIIEEAIKELTSLISAKCISIENKRVTATIHYRLCPDHQSARREILSAIENSRHTRNLQVMQESKYGINLLPPLKGDKGTGVTDLIQEYDLRGGVYMGDDVTDIYAFRAIRAAASRLDFHGFAIGITSPEMPETLVAEADFTLNGVSDVERFLGWLSQTASDLN